MEDKCIICNNKSNGKDYTGRFGLKIRVHFCSFNCLKAFGKAMNRHKS